MAQFMCQYSLSNTPGVVTDISPHYMSDKFINEAFFQKIKPLTLKFYWINAVGPLTGWY